MSKKDFSLIAGIIFIVIAILHVLRLIMAWPASIGGWNVPMWLSWIALIVAGFLGIQGFKFSKGS